MRGETAMSHDPIRVRIEPSPNERNEAAIRRGEQMGDDLAKGVPALIILVVVLAPIAPILFGAMGVWQLLDKIGVHDVFKIISVLSFLGGAFYVLSTYKYMRVAYMTAVTLFYAGWAFTAGSDYVWGAFFFVIVSLLGAGMTVLVAEES